MESVFRAAAVYFVVWFLVRISGKRNFAEITPFDFILYLIIGESTQQALLGNDFSIVNAVVVVCTLLGIDIGLSLVKAHFPRVGVILDGMPLVLVDHGELLKDRMKKERIDTDDIMQAARKQQGLERLDQIKFAVLERSGGISIIPMDK